MVHEEQRRVLIFLGILVALYVQAAAWFAVRAIIHRISKRQPSLAERRARNVVLGIAVLGVGCGAYARFVEPYWLEISNVQLSSSHWHGMPLRIVHLSDLHSDPVVRLEDRLPDVVRMQHPDLIVFTGDSINSLRGLDNFKRCLTALARIAPTLVVRGNWDVWYWGRADLFGGTGAHEVANSRFVVPVRGNQVWVGGLSVDEEAGLPELMKSAPVDSLRILLHHYPDQLIEAARFGVDLYLGGHTHGGQIALPFYGAIVTFAFWKTLRSWTLSRGQHVGLHQSRHRYGGRLRAESPLLRASRGHCHRRHRAVNTAQQAHRA